MKTYKIFFIIVCLIVASRVYGIEGYDKTPMYGNSVFPLTDVDVKVSEINVSMIRKENDTSTKITSKYVLENQSMNEMKFKVAFPVESNCRGCTRMPDNFRVLVNNVIITTFTSKIISKDYYSGIRKALGITDMTDLKKIYGIPLIVWEVSVKPREKKIITTEYTTEWIGDSGGESFIYRLGALYLWKGKINKAYFSLELGKHLIDNIKAHNPSAWPKITIDPKRYQVRGHAIEWFFNDLKQEQITHLSVDVDYRKRGLVGD